MTKNKNSNINVKQFTINYYFFLNLCLGNPDSKNSIQHPKTSNLISKNILKNSRLKIQILKTILKFYQ